MSSTTASTFTIESPLAIERICASTKKPSNPPAGWSSITTNRFAEWLSTQQMVEREKGGNHNWFHCGQAANETECISAFFETKSHYSEMLRNKISGLY